MTEEKVIYFAKYDYRGQGKVFGIKPNDRTRHVYVIGKTGMGKSTMLENMAVQDIRNGNGMAFIDPHGATAETILSYVPEERIQDVIYFAPFDIEHPISFNVMEDVGYEKRHLVASGLMSAFKKIWQDAWSARMEYILTNTLLALLEYPESTLIDVNKMLVDKAFRKKVVEHVQDPIVKAFWVEEFASYTDRYTQEATPAIQNKIGQFVSNPLIRNIIGQKTSSFDFRKVMDEKKILIMNLSKGRMGDTNTQLLGSMLVIKIYLAAMSRADLSPVELQKLPNFYFFVDEFQSFANETFADILSEARKYKLNLTIAHQYIEQMPEEVRDAVFGNVGTMIAFRVGAFDAEVLEKEFAPVFLAEDIVNLGFAQIYLKLMIDGLSSKPFSATTLPPLEHPEKDYKQEIIEYTRAHYAKPRAEVEESVRTRNAVPAPVSAGAPSQKEVKKEDRPPHEREAARPVPKAITHAPPRAETPASRAETPRPTVALREGGPREDPHRASHVPHVPHAAPRPSEALREGRPYIEKKREERTQAIPAAPVTHKPFGRAFRETPPAPRAEHPIATVPPLVPSAKPERTETPTVSLKMLQSNKKDTRSSEHLSALREALGEVLKNESLEKKEGNPPAPKVPEGHSENAIEKKSDDVQLEKREEQTPIIKEPVLPPVATATSTARADMPPLKTVAPRKPRVSRKEESGNAHFGARPGEIPEETLRKMLRVEEE